MHKFDNSSSIEHCDHNIETNTLIIKFTNGGTYHYPNCHKDNYEALKAAASPGGHFHTHIRPNYKGIKQ